MTTTDTPTLSDQLKELAKEFTKAASRAEQLATLDARLYEAAQLRLVAQLTINGENDELAKSWLDAGRRMLEAYDAADMDAVHASRAIRRAERIEL